MLMYNTEIFFIQDHLKKIIHIIYRFKKSDAAESPANSTEKLNEENQRSQNRNHTENEFVSDSYDHESLNVEEIKSDLRQLNLDNKKTQLFFCATRKTGFK